MSCGAALAISLLFTDPATAAGLVETPTPDAPASVATEPLFAGLVVSSADLKSVVDGWISVGRAEQAEFWAGAEFADFKARAADLAARDMQGHLTLKARELDGDLKCILRGISEDMPRKVEAVERAPSAAERRIALDELGYLLNDNAEVILSPPQPQA